MARVKLSASRVQQFILEDGKQQSYLYDTESRGLAVRATRGSKSFIFERRVNGKTMRTTLGSVNDLTIEDARKKADALIAQIANKIDPRVAKAQADVEAELKAEQARIALAKLKAETTAQNQLTELQKTTLADVWPAYIAARKHRWSNLSLRDHLRAVQRPGEPHKRTKGKTVAAPLVSLLDCRLIDLSADRIKEWLETETATRPSSAARCFRLLRGCLNWCNEDGCIYAGLAPRDSHRAKRVREALPSNGTKNDCLQKEMLLPWFSAVRMHSNPIVSAYLQTLLLTGARTGELINLKWDNVDFKWLTLTISDKATKHGRSATEKLEATRTIPLTPYVASLLAQLPHRNEFVFSSPKSASGKITDPNYALTCIVRTAGLPHLTVHGLRRSFGTLAEWTEAPVGVVAQIEGRKPTAIAEKHYRRRPIDLLRMWHTKIETWILEQGDVRFYGNASQTESDV